MKRCPTAWRTATVWGKAEFRRPALAGKKPTKCCDSSGIRTTSLSMCSPVILIIYMENIFDTPELRKKGEPLPGWIVGTGGAERAKLPVPASEKARQDVYGYLVGTVAADGMIQFGFQEIQEADVQPTTRRDYPATLVHWCFAHNSQNADPGAGEITPHCAPPLSPNSPPPKFE